MDSIDNTIGAADHALVVAQERLRNVRRAFDKEDWPETASQYNLFLYEINLFSQYMQKQFLLEQMSEQK